MATPHEREQALGPIVEAARRDVAVLTQRLAAAENRARQCYAAADAAGGDGAHMEVVRLRGELSAAEARAATLAEAALAVSAERQRADDEARLEALTAAMTEAADEAHAQLVTVAPALSAAKRALQLAQQAEDLARKLDGQRHALSVHLEGSAREEHGLRIMPPLNSPYTRVAALLERDRLLTELLQNPGY